MSDRSTHSTPVQQWQSLDQLAGTASPSGEFTPGVTEPPQFTSPLSRRGFMALLSASMALTAASCRRPLQKLIPAVRSNQVPTPGLPVEYTTVWSNGNVAFGALVKSREGRPIKVKGNDKHPVNIGRSSAVMQASILSLYDPDRIRRARVNRGQTSYENAVQRIADAVQEASSAGKAVAIAIDEHASPTFAALLAELTSAIPNARVVTMPAVVCDNPAIANASVLGIDGYVVPDLSKANVIVAVEADILGTDPLALYHTTRFAAKRSPNGNAPSMSTLVVAESQYTLTGANADVRTRMHPSQFDAFLGLVEQSVGAGTVGADLLGSADATTRAAAEKAGQSLRTAGAAGVVLVGRHCSPRAHAISLSINAHLGSLGSGQILDAVNVIPMSGARAGAIGTLQQDMASGAVHAFIAVNTNPEYSATPAFKAALASVPFRAAINLYEDETAGISHVSIPASHYLETWGDAITFDGTISLRQPMIAPLNDGVPSLEDTLMAITRKIAPAAFGEVASYYEYVRARWMPVVVDETGWAKVLQEGVVAQNRVGGSPVPSFAGASALAASSAPLGRVVVASLDLGVGTGADANNGWLQEMPDPVTKITWDNVALISPATAVELGIAASTAAKDVKKANEQVITITTANGSVDLPVWVQLGMADGVIATQLGFGRTKGGTVCAGVGSNAYQLAGGHHTTGYTAVTGVEVVSGKRHRIATTQDHHTLDDGNGERQIAHSITMGDLASGKLKEHDLNPHYYSAGKDKDNRYETPLSITPDFQYKGHRWGMVIDMSACTGCSSCVVACQSENNIPVVGKDQVMRGREMQWIRIDRYYTGDMQNPDTVVEPMLCQHCENAPCENVCPVAATTHSPEGLNEMTYNRCVGTRYCLNNCPYKVRRFNFLNYTKDQRAPLDLVFNPEVSKRDRGVMEKCTFCVQRINEAKYHAKDAGRPRVIDGEAVTACQEACPAGAIIFGDLNDSNSRVSVARRGERGFHVLAELNVRPSVTYLAKVRNRAQQSKQDNGHHS